MPKDPYQLMLQNAILDTLKYANKWIKLLITALPLHF